MPNLHSGTVLDLPYRFVADGDHVQMERNDNFDLSHVADIAGFAIGMAASMAMNGADLGSAVEAVADECCVIL